MGNSTILYGYILAYGENASLNATRIAALGRQDAWPHLTSDLFAVPDLEHSYNDHLISFGTVYKNFDLNAGWPEWRVKFEGLLRTMPWAVAHVYLEIESFGRCHFQWMQDMWRRSAFDLPQDAKRALTALREARRAPVERWTFSGGPIGNSDS